MLGSRADGDVDVDRPNIGFQDRIDLTNAQEERRNGEVWIEGARILVCRSWNSYFSSILSHLHRTLQNGE